MRIAILGNAGGGKSTLARRLASEHGLPYAEVDSFLWTPDWELTPEAEYEARHGAVLAGERWMLDGMGRLGSLDTRFERATAVILVDLPLWQHYWLAAERQAAWAAGTAQETPGGHGKRPETRELFEFMWTVDRDVMPQIRAAVAKAEGSGTSVYRITDVADLETVRL
ncbi:MAG: hypothetical protein P1U88_20260 [Thalassobaculaceae bacterium]|nr:hypothetical protein [Thalassobaculaceae bacterium]